MGSSIILKFDTYSKKGVLLKQLGSAYKENEVSKWKSFRSDPNDFDIAY